MFNILNSYTAQIVSVGTILLGVVCGLIGTFAVLKKESLVGDTVSHAALPGICFSYILTGEKELTILLIGALFSGLMAYMLINFISKTTNINFNNILALVLSTFFGFGIVLITYIQKLPGANKAGLNKFIFGQSAAILKSDVYLIISVLLIVLIFLTIYWFKFKIIIFDKIYAETIYGEKVKYINFIMSFLIVICVVIGLEIVGVILMSSLLIVPAVSARQWSNNFNVVTLLSMLIGGGAGFVGSAISSSDLNLPTGPVIILILSIIVFISLIFSNKRGLLKRYIYKKNRQKEIIKELTEL